MTPEQFRRWQTFSLRMAHRGFPRYRKPHRRQIAGYVKEFFRRSFPKCHNGEHTRWCSAELVARIRDWDDTDRRGGARHWESVDYVCDLMSDFVTNLEGMKRRLPERIEDSDPSGETWDDYEYRRNEAWGGPIRCCVRAGLDMAGEPSAGVLGFSVANLRRMYRGQIPDWLNVFWHRPWGDREGQSWYPIDLNIAPDETPLWL